MTKKKASSKRETRCNHRKENRARKDYFKEYYSGERYERQKEKTARDSVMKIESGYFAIAVAAYGARKKKALLGRQMIIYVEGRKLVGWKYALENLIKNLAPSTIKQYLQIGYIPQPPYRAKASRGYRKYYSMYQIGLINLCWSKAKKKKSLKERVERLHEKWKQDPLLGGKSDDRDDS